MADKEGTFEVGRTSDGQGTIALNGDSGTVTVGCGPERPFGGQTGRLELLYRDGQLLCRIRAGTPILSPKVGGQIDLFDDQGRQTVTLGGQSGDLWLGGNEHDGDIRIRNAAGTPTIRLEGADAALRLGGGEGGPDGDLVLYSANLPDTALPKGTVHIDGGSAHARLGGHGASGRFALFSGTPDMADVRNATVVVDGATADAWMGGNGANGDIMLFAAETTGADLRNTSKANIYLDGGKGDIILRNADCAEDFDVADSAAPGDVLVLGSDGRLRCCDSPYDKAVVGVVSGAGGFKAGLVLDRREESPGTRVPVALMGKTFCNVDAAHGAVEIGDLLTTSSTPGHAMVASNRAEALGTILGKALAPLEEGRRLIPILVTLQ